MSKLEELAVGCHVNGLVSDEPVQIIAVSWYGSAVLDITYKTSQGQLGNQLVYREDEARLQVLENRLPWSFDADGDTMRLVSEAYRINLAHLFDPYLAVHTSSVEPLPHQISAVYQEMIRRLPLRYEDDSATKVTAEYSLNDDGTVLVDNRCLDEYTTYVRRQNGSYGAVDGKHDDLLMTRAIALHICFHEMPMPRFVSHTRPKSAPISNAGIW